MQKNLSSPQLLVDDHHGHYMAQLAFTSLLPVYRDQAVAELSPEDIKSLEAGPDDEFYNEATDNLTNVTFTDPDGEKFNIQFAEGGLWIVPVTFYDTPEAEDFFS